MITREELVRATWDFLNSIVDVTISELGSPPTRIQRSNWMERTGPGTASSKMHERVVIDTMVFQMLYAEHIHEHLSTEKEIWRLLLKADIPDNEIYGGFIIPLLLDWLKIRDPFILDESTVSPVIGSFVDAVINKAVKTLVKNILVGIDLESNTVILEEGVCIRPINQEELWGLGDEYLPTKPWLTYVGPSNDWNILEMELKHRLGEDISEVTGGLRESIIAGLLLLYPGIFGIEQIVKELNYGIPTHRGWSETLRIKRGVSPYLLDAQIAERFRLSWPHVSEIIRSKDHYLRLPITRLIDGAIRSNPRDAVIDYTVGLEALLTQGVTSELKYRFALRGSSILNWDGGNKRDSFKQLKELYDIRSSIIHGNQVDENKLAKVQLIGQEALRRVCWWFLSQNKTSLRIALENVDDRILE